MKNISTKYISIFSLFLLIGFTSCDAALEVDLPSNQLSSNTVYASDPTAEAAVNGIYQSMVTGFYYNQTLESNGKSYLTKITPLFTSRAMKSARQANMAVHLRDRQWQGWICKEVHKAWGSKKVLTRIQAPPLCTKSTREEFPLLSKETNQSETGSTTEGTVSLSITELSTHRTHS